MIRLGICLFIVLFLALIITIEQMDVRGQIGTLLGMFGVVMLAIAYEYIRDQTRKWR